MRIHCFVVFLCAVAMSWSLHGQRVGINTVNPLASLHIENGSFLVTGPISIPGPNAAPILGSGTRMMWHTDKAAFRTGRVDGAQWNTEYLGLFSLASGLNNTATGSCSFSAGQNNFASGVAAVSLGLFTKASHVGAVSAGYFTTASGAQSVALGDHSTASNTNSFASGLYSGARSPGSFTHGIYTIARANNSVVFGRYNDTTAVSVQDWIDTDPLFIIGNGSAINARKNALTVLKNGNIGINTIQPAALLHIVKGVGSGTTTHPSAAGVFESNQQLFLQLAVPNNQRAGIIRAGNSNSIRQGVVFDLDSSLVLYNQGVARMVINSDGYIGIGTDDPSANLHVTEGIKIGGPNAAQINTIHKGWVQADLPTISANGSYNLTFNIPGISSGGTVTVCPDTDLPDGIIIAYTIVSAQNTIAIQFRNVSAVNINPPIIGYYFTVIQ